MGRTYMGSSDQVVADDRYFYSTWTDTRDSHLSHANQPDIRFAKIPKDLNGSASDLAVAVTAGPTRPRWWAPTEFEDGRQPRPGRRALRGGDDEPPADFAITSVDPGQGSCVATEENKVSCALGALARGGDDERGRRADAGVAPGPALVTAASTSGHRSSARRQHSERKVGRPRPNTVTSTYSSGLISAATIVGPDGSAEFPLKCPTTPVSLMSTSGLQVTHYSPNGIVVTLIAPDGTEVRLVDERGFVADSPIPPTAPAPSPSSTTRPRSRSMGGRIPSPASTGRSSGCPPCGVGPPWAPGSCGWRTSGTTPPRRCTAGRSTS